MTATTSAATASTATKGSRLVGAAALACLAFTLVMGLAVSPEDEVQGDAVRLMYVHVPSAWLAYVSFLVTAFASAMYLWRRTRSVTWDRVAGCSAEIGVVFTALALLTGMVWGRITWGQFWTWDARLTSTALMFLSFLGYLALRRQLVDPAARARVSAVLGVLGLPFVVLVHQSVNWWDTTHQQATVLRPDRDPQIDGTMLFTLFSGVVAFTLVYLWLMVHRNRVAMLEEIADERGLDIAIAERRAESGLGGAEAAR
ncbi:MAG TPA: cytochrome c biogenesis protein CcsA [Acidimicrobiales bacterium]